MKQLLEILAITAATACLAVAADAAAGKAAYDKACKSCHGATGEPNAAIAKSLKVDMQPLGSKEVQAMSDADLKNVITSGKGKMKPVKSVAGSADDIVAHVRTFKK